MVCGVCASVGDVTSAAPSSRSPCSARRRRPRGVRLRRGCRRRAGRPEEAQAGGFRLAKVVGGLGDAIVRDGRAGPARPPLRRPAERHDPDPRARPAASGPRSSTSPAIVSAGGEQGLLGLAFHPDYARNGRFFVYYTDRAGDTPGGRVPARERDAGQPGQRPAAALDRRALREPQRRAPRVRPRRLALHRHRRRRQRRRPAGQRPGPGRAARQDPAHRRRRARAGQAATASRPTTRSSRGGGAARDLGLRPAQPLALLVRPRSAATSGSATWARTTIEEVDFRPPRRRARRQLRLERLRGPLGLRRAAARCAAARRCGPVAEYTHAKGCSVTGGYVYRGTQGPGAARPLRLRRLLHRRACGPCAPGPNPGRPARGHRPPRRRRSPTSPRSARASPASSTCIANGSLYRFARR